MPPTFNAPDNSLDHAWWVEVKTAYPRCIYYFGPFEHPVEACQHQNGYVEDLMEENARGITAQVKHCSPPCLTLEEPIRPQATTRRTIREYRRGINPFPRQHEAIAHLLPNTHRA